MAKQKSGLGKGLGALFDGPQTFVSEEANSTTPAKTSAVNESVSVEAVSTEPAVTVEETLEEVVSATPATEGSTTEGEPHELYVSEDALEHAKVVEREARPTKPAATPAKKSGTAKRPTPVASRKSGAENRPSETVSKPKSTPATVQSSVKQPTPLKSPSMASAAKIGSAEEKGMVGEVLLAHVHPNPDQPRTLFKPEEIEELAASIKRDGLLQPILVRRMGDQYEIIAGERRWQACRSLGMETIPVRFWMADEDKALELAIIENIQRSDLNPVEEAYAYKRLMERQGKTQSEVAQMVSKGRSTIANALRLLELPEEAQQLLFEEKISAGHARAILSIPSIEGRKSLTNKLMEDKLSVRETEAIARLLAGKENAKEAPTARVPAPASFKKAARSLSKALEMPVRVKTAQGKNKIEIQFKDEAELEKLVKLLS